MYLVYVGSDITAPEYKCTYAILGWIHIIAVFVICVVVATAAFQLKLDIDLCIKILVSTN